MQNHHFQQIILYLRHLLVLIPLWLVISNVGRAQEGLGVQFFMPANPSPYLSDWNDGSMPVRLVITNESSNTYFVSVDLSILKDGQAVVRTNISLMPAELVVPGINSYEPRDFIQYDALQFSGGFEEQLAQTGKLPAGFYEVCIQIFELEYQQWIPGRICRPVMITDYQPPRLILPPERVVFRPGEIPLFYFSTVMPPIDPSSAQYPVIYRLVVMEVWPDQTLMDAFLGNMPVVEVFIEEPTRLYWPPDFELPESGMHYVWNVQAIDAMGNPVGQNEGWAEPSIFSVQSTFDMPSDSETSREIIIFPIPALPVDSIVIDTSFVVVAPVSPIDQTLQDADVHATPVTPVVTEPVDADPDDPPVVTEPVDADPDDPPVVTEPVDPDPDDPPVVTEPVDPDPDESPVVTEPVDPDPDDPPVVTEPVDADPDDPPVVTEPVDADPDDPPVVTEPVDADPDDPPVVTEPVDADPDPGVAEECVCHSCFMIGISVFQGGTLLTIHDQDPMIVGENYTFIPSFYCDCPPECQLSFEYEISFQIFDRNDVLIAEYAEMGHERTDFTPRRSGRLVVSIQAVARCEDTECPCESVSIGYPVVGRTVAEGIVSQPGRDITEAPPGVSDPGDSDDQPPGISEVPPGPPPIEPPPSVPPEVPPGDPVLDGCGPSIDQDPGLPIVLNVYLEENQKFLYPRAVPLHALGIDWDFAYFLCTDCDGSVTRYRYPVMDKVSTYRWRLDGKGSLNEPFTAQQIIDLEQQIAALLVLLAAKEEQLQELTARIEALPGELAARKERAARQIEEIEALNDTFRDEIEQLQAAYDALDKQYIQAHQLADTLRQEIALLRIHVDEYMQKISELDEKLKNHPTEEEKIQMEVVETMRAELDLHTQLIWDIEQEIIETNHVLQNDIQQALGHLEAAVDQYNHLNVVIDATQQEIHRVLRQVYSVPVNVTLMNRLRDWRESADHFLIYLLDTLQLAYDSIVVETQLRNEINRQTSRLIFVADTIERQQISQQISQLLTQFLSEAEQRCLRLPPGESIYLCRNMVYWLTHRNPPFLSAVAGVVESRPQFSAQQLHALDSLRNVLSGYETEIGSLRSIVEDRNQAYTDGLENFTMTMEQLEKTKADAIAEREASEAGFLESQSVLRSMILERDSTFAVNEPVFRREYFEVDSLRMVAGLELAVLGKMLGEAVIDSLMLHQEMLLLLEEIDARAAVIEANKNVIETLNSILEIDVDAMLEVMEAQKELLEQEIEAIKDQLDQLQQMVEVLKGGNQKHADGPMVYYIPPPLEVIMKDKPLFEELKAELAEAEAEYQLALEFKAGLQLRFSYLLENISKNLRAAKTALDNLDELEQKADELAGAFQSLEDEKKAAYEQEKEALEEALSQEREKSGNYDEDAIAYASQGSEHANSIENLKQEIKTHQATLKDKGDALSRQRFMTDSLENVFARQSLRLRVITDSIRLVNGLVERERYTLEAARDQLIRAVAADNQGLETQARSMVAGSLARVEEVESALNALHLAKDLLALQQNTVVALLEGSREDLATRQLELYEASGALDDLKEELHITTQLFLAARQKLMEALEKSRMSEALIEGLEGKLAGFPTLNEMLGSDQQLQDANQAKLAAEREKQKMEDVRDRSKSIIREKLEEKDQLEDESEEKLAGAIDHKHKARQELRDFLLEEFNHVTYTDTLYITALDDVLDQWRSRDDPVTVMAVIRYSFSRLPELLFEEKSVPSPAEGYVSVGSCDVDITTLPTSGINPVPSSLLGPEPRTIALIYDNGKPLWPEWPVMPNTGKLLSESVLIVHANGSDTDLFEHYCSTQTENCLDPPPSPYPVADLLNYSWDGDGAFFNEQKYSNFVLWEPKRVSKPDCDEDQQIRTIYQASTIEGDPEEERISLETIEPGIMIEVTDSLMGFPDHQRDAVARIVKGNYEGLPGEAIEFTVRLIEGQSDGWGFGGDTIFTATTDHLGYAKVPFAFGDGFARFEFTVRWIREEEVEKSCETNSFLALSPLYLNIHYFGYSAEDASLSGAKELWNGTDIDGVLVDLPQTDTNGEKPLLAIAGLLDHNRDFVNEMDLHFSLDDKAGSGNEAGLDPETDTTDLFGIVYTFVSREVEEGVDLVVQAEPDEEYQPVCFPPKDEKEFSTARGRRFKIGKDHDLFVIVVDEPFSPSEPVNGTGRIEVTIGGQVMMVLRDLELQMTDVLLEIRGQDTIAIDGRVSWHATMPLTMDMLNFTFGLDSLVLLPGRGGGIGGQVNHRVLSYPVRFYAEVGTDGDFYGEVMDLPELEVAGFKLHRSAHLVIDWSNERSPGALSDDFKGIVIRKAALDLPPVFRSSGSKDPSTLTANDFAIGSSGVHGTISLSGAPVQIGYAGFELVCDSIALSFAHSELKSYAIKGIFRMPKPVEGGIVATVSKQGDTGWSLELSTENPIHIPKIKTTLALNSGTKVVWDSQSETGTVMVNATVSSDHFSEIEIVGLEVNNNGLFKAEAIHVDVGLTIAGGFDLRANMISFSIGSGEVEDHVRVDGNLGISLLAESKIKGALVLSTGPAVDFIFEEASIEFERGPVEFKGSFAYNSREFRGDFDIHIKNMVGLRGLLIVGSMPIDEEHSYSYWYAELVLKVAVPLGQSGLSLLELGGGLGYNYQPPIGSQEGMPVNNDTFTFKALIAIGNAVPLPGKLFMGRLEMVLMPGIFSLNGKVWVLDRENAIFGEGQLNLRWEPQTKVDGFIRSYIAISDAEGKILRFNGKINYDIHSTGFLIMSEEISGMLFQKVKGEASVLFTAQQIDLQGKVYFDANTEKDVLVLTLKAYVNAQASASLTYNNPHNRLQAVIGFKGSWGVSADTAFGEYTIFKGAIGLQASIDASPQHVRLNASASIYWEVLWFSDTTELEFGFEI